MPPEKIPKIGSQEWNPNRDQPASQFDPFRYQINWNQSVTKNQTGSVKALATIAPQVCGKAKSLRQPGLSVRIWRSRFLVYPPGSSAFRLAVRGGFRAVIEPAHTSTHINPSIPGIANAGRHPQRK